MKTTLAISFFLGFAVPVVAEDAEPPRRKTIPLASRPPITVEYKNAPVKVEPPLDISYTDYLLSSDGEWLFVLASEGKTRASSIRKLKLSEISATPTNYSFQLVVIRNPPTRSSITQLCSLSKDGDRMILILHQQAEAKTEFITFKSAPYRLHLKTGELESISP